MAEGVLRFELLQLGLQDKVRVDSAGTHASQPGRRVDSRASKLCSSKGVELGKLRARQVRPGDFERFDLIYAMDRSNLDWLLENSPANYCEKISMIGSLVPENSAMDVPDPYYGAIDGFERVFELLEGPIDGLISNLVDTLGD